MTVTYLSALSYVEQGLQVIKTKDTSIIYSMFVMSTFLSFIHGIIDK